MAAISNEIYVVNEESIIALSLLTVYYAIFKYGGPAYTKFADGYIQRMKDILYSAKEDHKAAVVQRMESVKELGGVVEVTKQLFDVSKVRTRHGRVVCVCQGLMGCSLIGPTPGNGPSRGQGIRTRAADGAGPGGQDGAGVVGPLRGPGEAASAAGVGRGGHQQDPEGTRKPEAAAADSATGRVGCGE